MRPRLNIYQNGSASMERVFPSGLYVVTVYRGSEVYDRVRCDTYRGALEYWRAFNRIAKRGEA
jgi:hypothetical protein